MTLTRAIEVIQEMLRELEVQAANGDHRIETADRIDALRKAVGAVIDADSREDIW